MEFEQIVDQVEELLAPGAALALECTEPLGVALRAALCSRHAGGVGVVAEGDGLYERMPVGRYLRCFAALAGRSGAVEGAARQMGLESLWGVRIHKLTPGQARRVAFAREIARGSRLLLLDEPLRHLDDADLRLVLPWLEALSGQGYACLCTTQSTRALYLLPGRRFRLDEHGLRGAEPQLPEAAEASPPSVQVEKIPARADEKLYLFNPAEIDYLESSEGKTLLHIGQDSFPCALSLDELTVRLARYGFFRCHRSYLVNMQKVTEVVKWTRSSYSLRLGAAGDAGVPLSRNRVAEMKEQYNF